MSFMTLRMAVRAIARNKVRAGLTTLGVVIGVAAVIAMVAIGQGATHMVRQQIASMGQNLYTIMPGATSSGALSHGLGSAQTLTPEDGETLRKNCPSARAVSVIIRTRAQIVYQNLNWSPATVQGCDASYLEVRSWGIAEGEAFEEHHVRGAAQVCLIGATVVKQVFPDEDPVGKHVRIKNVPFTIIGVLEKKGSNTWGSDQDDALLLPWTTVQKKLQGSAFRTVDQILVSAESEGAMQSLEEEVRTALRHAHRITPNARGEYEDDFTIRNMTELMNAITSTTRVMTGLLAAIASISLLVGGIGIMNIMLVSVTERTREIGLRMAVGARGRDILAQFLVEATVLSALGGAIGIAIGAGMAVAAAGIMRWPVMISPSATAIAVLFSAAVGAFFGFYPAWRASRLDPIEALRYE